MLWAYHIWNFLHIIHHQKFSLKYSIYTTCIQSKHRTHTDEINCQSRPGHFFGGGCVYIILYTYIFIYIYIYNIYIYIYIYTYKSVCIPAPFSWICQCRQNLPRDVVGSSSCSVVFSCACILLYMTNHIIRAFGVVCMLHCAVVSAGYLYKKYAFGAHSELTDYIWFCAPGRACATGLNDKMDHVWYSLDPRHAAPRASVIFFGGDSKFLIPSLNHKKSSPSLP